MPSSRRSGLLSSLPSPILYHILAEKLGGGKMGRSPDQGWRHPGGKLRELGPENLSDAELVAILISAGIKGRPAEKIAEELLTRFGSLKGMANQPIKEFLEIKGLGAVKIHRIAAAFEIARRTANQVIKDKT